MGNIHLLHKEQARQARENQLVQLIEDDQECRRKMEREQLEKDNDREENLWLCGVSCGMMIGMVLWFSTFNFVGSPPHPSIALIGALGFFISGLGTPFLFVWLKQRSNIFIGLMGVIPITSPLWLAWLATKVIGG